MTTTRNIKKIGMWPEMADSSSMRVDYPAIAAKIREHHPGPNPGMTIAEYSVESSVAAFADALGDLADEGKQTSAGAVPTPSDANVHGFGADVVAETRGDLENTHSPHVGMIGYIIPSGRRYVFATCNGETKWWPFGDKENVMVSRVRTFRKG